MPFFLIIFFKKLAHLFAKHIYICRKIMAYLYASVPFLNSDPVFLTPRKLFFQAKTRAFQSVKMLPHGHTTTDQRSALQLL